MDNIETALMFASLHHKLEIARGGCSAIRVITDGDALLDPETRADSIKALFGIAGDIKDVLREIGTELEQFEDDLDQGPEEPQTTT